MTAMKKTGAALVALLIATMALALAASPAADAAPRTLEIAGVQSPGGSSAECPTGSVEDGNGKCRKPVADAQACPKGALGVPDACYIFVDHVVTKMGDKECRVGSIMDDKGMCRMPVANVVGCPEGALGVAGGCYIFVHKVLPPVLTFG